MNRVPLLPGKGAEGHQPMKLADRVPGQNAGNAAPPLPPVSVKLSGHQVRRQNAINIPYQPAAGVRYEPGKPVKDAIRAFEKK